MTPQSPTSNSKPIALITGANRGIGYTLALTLARDYSFHILLGSRNPSSGAAAAATLRDEGLSVEPLTIDLGDDDSITYAATTVRERYGRLDVLVNNAAILLDKNQESEKERRELWRKTFETNVFGTAAATEAFIPLLSQSTVPRIVFLSSTLGSITDRLSPSGKYTASHPIYRSSKAAVNMLAAHYASKFRDEEEEEEAESGGANAKKWKVNVVCPGYVKTEMNGGEGYISVEEAMPNIVRVCTLGDDGETGTFSDNAGPVPW
jgi:NAD(P)-dependent dehydrogenase (short-subunit alcohol dehydrogenase family)